MSRIDEALKVLERAQYCAEHKCSECIYYDKCPDDLYDAEKETFIPIKYELCEDCVSREAVNDLVDELARAISDERCCMSRGRSTATIMQDILDLPPVTPKQRTGKWIQRHVIGGRNIEMTVCSECGEEFSYDAETGVSEYNFCPNCGAKMEGERANEITD